MEQSIGVIACVAKRKAVIDMPRYIDADWIYEKVENRYRVSSGIEHRCERDLLDLICVR